MIIKSATITVKDECIETFIEATIENQKNSIKEEGIIRFDVLQNKDDSNSFMLYEVYKNEVAVEEHKKTKHFTKWDNTVNPLLAKPRERVMYSVIAPTEDNY
ncbi:MAG TPA: putative quinol monooxygenase [Clostridium sp.]|uniref:putative quinol monooxygenase n=1 Tax=Clostridium sp. TaxID=1506 RepID=UPI002F940176